MEESHHKELQVIKKWAMNPKMLEVYLSYPNLTAQDIEEELQEEGLDYEYLVKYIEGVWDLIVLSAKARDWDND